MTENPNVGSAPATGAEGTPNPAVSPQGTQPIGDVTQLLSALEGKFVERFSSLEKNLTSQLSGLQKVQGEIDRSRNAFQEQLARLEQYEKRGLSRQEALSEMEADDESNKRYMTLEQRLAEIAARLESGGTQSNRQQQVAEVFASKGLDPKDPRIAPFLVKDYSSPEAMELAAYRLREELASTPNPTLAQQASLTGGNSAPLNAEEKMTRLETLYKNYTQNRAEIEGIEKELRAAGHI